MLFPPHCPGPPATWPVLSVPNLLLLLQNESQKRESAKLIQVAGVYRPIFHEKDGRAERLPKGTCVRSAPAWHPRLGAPVGEVLPTAGGSPGSLQTPPEGWLTRSMPHLGADGRRHVAGPQLGGGGGGHWPQVECLHQGTRQTLQTRPAPASRQPFPRTLLPTESSVRDCGQNLSLPEASHQWRTNPRWRPAPNHAPSAEPNKRAD